MDREQIENLVDDIIDGNNTDAKDKFDELISSRVSTALDQRKQEIAQNVFNDEQPEQEEESEQ